MKEAIEIAVSSIQKEINAIEELLKNGHLLYFQEDELNKRKNILQNAIDSLLGISY